jgi:hypothetical protein
VEEDGRQLSLALPSRRTYNTIQTLETLTKYFRSIDKTTELGFTCAFPQRVIMFTQYKR